MHKDMQNSSQRFITPENSTHRRYEAGTLRNLRAAFLQQPHRPFFLPDRRGKRKPLPGPDRDERILALRNERNLSAAEIAAHLTAQEALPVSATTVAHVLKRAGLPKLWRRTAAQRAAGPAPVHAPVADHRALDLSPRRLRTEFGGLFLFAGDLARIGLDDMLRQHGLPVSAMIPPGCAFRSLLALKLWGIGRPSRVMPETIDNAPGLVLLQTSGTNYWPSSAPARHPWSAVLPHRLVSDRSNGRTPGALG